MIVKPRAPKGLTPAERAAFRATVDQVTAAGRDPHGVAALIGDYVRLEARIARMIEDEAKARSGKIRDRVTRALSIATAERRRLHAAIASGR